MLLNLTERMGKEITDSEKLETQMEDPEGG